MVFLYDVDYVHVPTDKDGVEQGVIRLFLKEGDNTYIKYVSFDPYFYYDGEIPSDFEDMPQIKRFERVERILNGDKKGIYKVILYNPSDVPKVKGLLSNFGKCYEYDIPFVKRFMIDNNVTIFSEVGLKDEGNDYVSILDCKPVEEIPLNKLSFDIETYNPHGTSDPRVDPIILLSYTFNGDTKVVSYKPSSEPYVVQVDSESDLLDHFVQQVARSDLLFGYNSSLFDLPYLRDRARKLNVKFSLGIDGSSFNSRRFANKTSISITGKLHLDVYTMVRFLAGIGAIKTNTYTLEEVYSEIFNESKEDVSKRSIWKMWEKDDLRDQLIKYSYSDAESTYKLGLKLLPIFVEIARTVNLTLDDAVNSTTGQLVETFLLKEVFKKGIVAPNKPSGRELLSRDASPIEGAYVKMPEPGIYDNIAVFDFRSLYPSIIVSHNISPDTLDPSCPEDKAYISPLGHRFRKEPIGLIPEVLSRILEFRKRLKAQLKTLDKDSMEYHYAYARQYAFKIIANSFYGMLRYIRARWYCRECAEATTAWERYYIKEVIRSAEEKGFKVLYSDTDSVFLLLGEHTKGDALEFMNEINRSLPKDMELELEDFYTRGVFVSKKSSESGAKKKYALISEDGHIKIRGFELVRRDWSDIAKETQREVLEIILKEGDVDRAVDLVRKRIEELKSGQVPLSKLVMHTVLRKKPSQYQSPSPEVAAALKGIKRGMKISVGYMIDYVITSKGNSISEKADLVDFVREGDYDPDYYINHQVIPAVEKILGALGYSADTLITGSKQGSLDQWF